MRIPASWAEKVGDWLLGRLLTPFSRNPGQPCWWVSAEPGAEGWDFSLVLSGGYWEVLPYEPGGSQGKWYPDVLARLPDSDFETRGYLMRQYNIHWRSAGSIIRRTAGRRAIPRRRSAVSLSLFISLAKGSP